MNNELKEYFNFIIPDLDDESLKMTQLGSGRDSMDNLKNIARGASK